MPVFVLEPLGSSGNQDRASGFPLEGGHAHRLRCQDPRANLRLKKIPDRLTNIAGDVLVPSITDPSEFELTGVVECGFETLADLPESLVEPR